MIAFDRATALVEIAHQVLRGTSPDRSPVDIMISIPIDALAQASCSADERCCDSLQVACCRDGTPISAATTRRLACDAGLIAMLEDANGNALSVGRKRRTIPASTKRALLRRDRKCRFPGCNARAFLEGHHLVHWVDGGATEMTNLISLCSFHHRFVHEYGFTIEFDAETNTVSAYEPAGHRWIPAVPRPEKLVDLGWPNIVARNERYAITEDTRPVWDATPVDYPEIVDVILRAEARHASSPDARDEDPKSKAQLTSIPKPISRAGLGRCAAAL